MKKFRIIGIIAIIVMIANIAINFEDGWRGFKEGYEDGARKHSTMPASLYRVSLEVLPLESTANDSIFIQEAGQKVPYWTSEITTYTKPSMWITLVMICTSISTLAFKWLP